MRLSPLLCAAVVMLMAAQMRAAYEEEDMPATEDVTGSDDAPAEEESTASRGAPFILLTKTMSATMIVGGQSVDVTVTARNYGSAAAYAFVLNDPVGEGFEPKTETREVLEVGDSVTMTYTITPKELGMLAIPPATATFTTKLGTGDIPMTATSNLIREEEVLFTTDETDVSPRGNLAVVTWDVYERENTRYIKEIAAFLTLSAITVFFPLFVYRSKQSQVDFLIRQSRKK